MRRKKKFPSFRVKTAVKTEKKKTFKRIAVISTDILSPFSMGGVATGSTAIAECLSKFGHNVTLVFVSRAVEPINDFHLWQLHYSQFGIDLKWLVEPDFIIEGMDPARLSYATYLYLKKNNFDIVHFPDFKGLAYFTLLAKKTSPDFDKTLICVTLYGPSYWGQSGNQLLHASPEDLLFYHLERKSVELADVVISPTQYFANWILAEKWKLPERTYVQHLPLNLNSMFDSKVKKANFRELVFFGRLETRKGLIEFCDALEKIPANFLSKLGITVVFLGSVGSARWVDARNFLSERSRTWTFNWKILSDYNQERALRYLDSNSVLVVMPSKDESMGYTVLECIKNEVPFLAADIEPFREIIDPRDHKKVLTETGPKIFANRILDALSKGGSTARSAIDFEENNFLWGNWNSSIKLKPVPSKKKFKRPPLVSVCVSHQNRPEFLEQSLNSLTRQDYPNFEVIIVDDASDTESARHYLKALPLKIKSRGWRLVVMPKSIGPIEVRNKAAKLAKGQFILFMDDDNVAKSWEISSFIRAMERTDSDILTCPFDRFEGTSEPEGKPIARNMFLGDLQGLNLFMNLYGDMNFFVKKNVFLKLGGLATKGKNVGAEDAEFLARAALKGFKLNVVPDALFWYRTHSSNFSSRLDIWSTLFNRIDPYLGLFENLDMKQLMLYSVGVWYRFFDQNCWLKDQLFPTLPYVKENPINFFQKRKIVFIDREHFRQSLTINGDIEVQFKGKNIAIFGSGNLGILELDLENFKHIYVRLNCKITDTSKIWIETSTKMGDVARSEKKSIQSGRNQEFIFMDLAKASVGLLHNSGTTFFRSLEICIEQSTESVLIFQSLEVFGIEK